MDSKSKVLVQNSELSNLYEDIAKDILKNLVFNSSHENQINQLVFISMLENALSHLADDTLDLFNKPKDEISKLNYIYKWNSLRQFESIKNIVEKEFKSDGLMSIVEDAKEKLFKEVETNLILSNEANSLKKFNLILNKYKTFKDLLRKVLDEC
jgi:hypothetical protein|tara:strand:- start:226 stop:687 length:462 start_codon:yes stop_codon:yes gene_type:complete